MMDFRHDICMKRAAAIKAQLWNRVDRLPLCNVGAQSFPAKKHFILPKIHLTSVTLTNVFSDNHLICFLPARRLCWHIFGGMRIRICLMTCEKSGENHEEDLSNHGWQQTCKHCHYIHRLSTIYFAKKACRFPMYFCVSWGSIVSLYFLISA